MNYKMSEELVKLTTRGRYAVMAMVELAKHKEADPVPLAGIAEKNNISLSYLEQLIAGLRRHDLVKSYRGPGGGYILSRPAQEILISDILIAAEDSTPAKRSEKNNFDRNTNCEETDKLWDNIGALLHNALKKVSLADVLNKHILAF